MKYQYKHKQAVLDCCFTDSVQSLSGGLDKTLKRFLSFIFLYFFSQKKFLFFFFVSYDFNIGSETVVGTHDEAIRCVCYCPEAGKHFFL